MLSYLIPFLFLFLFFSLSGFFVLFFCLFVCLLFFFFFLLLPWSLNALIHYLTVLPVYDPCRVTYFSLSVGVLSPVSRLVTDEVMSIGLKSIDSYALLVNPYH